MSQQKKKNKLMSCFLHRTLYSYDMETKEWSIVISDARYRSYSVVEVSHKRRFAAVGSISGHFTILSAGDKPNCALNLWAA